MGVVMAVSLPGSGRAGGPGGCPVPGARVVMGGVTLVASRGVPAAGLVVPGQIALVVVAEGDALAVACLAGLVAVQVQGSRWADSGPGDVARGDDGEVVPGQLD